MQPRNQLELDMGWSYLEKEKALDKLNIPYENSSTQVCIWKLLLISSTDYSLLIWTMDYWPCSSITFGPVHDEPGPLGSGRPLGPVWTAKAMTTNGFNIIAFKLWIEPLYGFSDRNRHRVITPIDYVITKINIGHAN